MWSEVRAREWRKQEDHGDELRRHLLDMYAGHRPMSAKDLCIIAFHSTHSRGTGVDRPAHIYTPKTIVSNSGWQNI